tara:strand:- start:149 stop:655 length:507 start_codon:yes stop_codon:yes gene_type:complete
MQVNDILMKKWCFGVNKSKPKNWLEKKGDTTQIVQRFPMYRTIALQIISLEKSGKQTWKIEANRFSSLTGRPKKVSLNVKKNKHGMYYITGQKKPYHKVSINEVTHEGMPPVGSLITVDKKHAIVVETGRNELTVFVNGKYKSVNVKPGKLKWWDDKLISSLPKRGSE